MGLSQLTDAVHETNDSDVKIALAHHPYNWYTEQEENNVLRILDRDFDFFLHGHEHSDWILSLNNCHKISVGCCYESPTKETGYNIVRTYIKDYKAHIYLRSYDPSGGGWVPKQIYDKTSIEGIWYLDRLPFATRKMSADARQPIRAKLSARRRITVRPRKPIDIFKYFTVAKAQDDEKFFVGRKNELAKGIGALMAPGASIAIHGKAGVGKSSLALQLGYIASGNHQKLVSDYEIPSKGFHFPVIYYSCKKTVDLDFSNVLLSVLLDRTLPFSINGLLNRIKKQLHHESNEMMKNQLDQLYKEGRTKVTLRLSVQLFMNLASLICEIWGGLPLVLILDEYDVVEDKSGLASNLKSYDFIKYVLSGTAHNILLLVQEHQSIPRQIAEGQIKLDTMDQDECKMILTLESKRSKGWFIFDDDARNELAKSSRGMPFFVHYYGRYSLDAALKRVNNKFNKPLVITLPDVNAAIKNRTKDLIYLDIKYLGIVEDNWKKECILNLLSYTRSDEVYLPEISSVAKEMGIAKQTTTKFVNSLVGKEVLYKTHKNDYEFADIRLKVFSRLRRPVNTEAYNKLGQFIKHERWKKSGSWLLPTFF